MEKEGLDIRLIMVPKEGNLPSGLGPACVIYEFWMICGWPSQRKGIGLGVTPSPAAGQA